MDREIPKYLYARREEAESFLFYRQNGQMGIKQVVEKVAAENAS